MSEAASDKKQLCPYCGGESTDPKQCAHCRGLFEPLSRQASQNAMGPWFVRDEANPFRPGCSYPTLRLLATRGKIGPMTVLRGPPTRQFWMHARNVPGVGHLFGECHACRAIVQRGDAQCGKCGASFLVDDDRQYLGLADVRLIPGQASAEEIALAARRASEGSGGGWGGGEQPIRLSTESSGSPGPSAFLAPRPHGGEEPEPIPVLAEPDPVPLPREPVPQPVRMSGEERMAEFDRMRNGQYDRDSGRGSRQRAMLMIVLALAGSGAIMVLVMWVLSVSAVMGKGGGAGGGGAPLQAGVPMNAAPPPLPVIAPNPQPKKP